MQTTRFVLLLLAVAVSTFAFDYYVVPEGSQSCPPDKECHDLFYYVSYSEDYFASNSTIVFLEGEHKLEREDHVLVRDIDSLGLTLIGQGQWVEGSEKTVWQSTVIIDCTKGRGGFSFRDSNNIVIEMLTMINCGSSDPTYRYSVFSAVNVWIISFQFIAIQYNTGVGINVENCINVEFKKNSFYYSNNDADAKDLDDCKQPTGSGIGINISGTYSDYDFMVFLSDSNFTKGCGGLSGITNLTALPTLVSAAGSISLKIKDLAFQIIRIHLSNLVLTQNRGLISGGLAAYIHSHSNILLTITNCTFLQEKAFLASAIWILNYNGSEVLVSIKNTEFLENVCFIVSNPFLTCYSLPAIVSIVGVDTKAIKNCTFSRNNGCSSVLSDYPHHEFAVMLLEDSTISDNNMTGLVVFDYIVIFNGKNEIRNNRNQQGAGITTTTNTAILIAGSSSLFFHNNTASLKGGAILVVDHEKKCTTIGMSITNCLLNVNGNTTAVYFSSNRAGQGGNDIYGGKLTDCINYHNLTIINYHESESGATSDSLFVGFEVYRHTVLNVGTPNETSWYFDTPLMKYFNFSDTDQLSSIATDPVMVCFCTNGSLLPNCSDRTRHMETYPGVQFNVTIATVGKYGGTSPGTVQLNVENAKLVRSFVHKQETIQCSPIQFLLQSSNNSYPTSALVDISVKGGAPGLSVAIMVNILECPVGFISSPEKCWCVQLLADSNVNCNMSLKPFRFQRSGNGWFAYINATNCVTGTANCPFDYCNRLQVQFDITQPDPQCTGGRTGVLCGQCQPELSLMLGSNRCSHCSNYYLFMLPAFALIGIVLVAMLMFLNLTVSVGNINGILFYANMIKLNEPFFFPNGKVPVVSQFISWLNLDFGIEVCLFDGLDGYWKTWLQFAFPIYLFLLTGCIIVGCRYSVRLCRLCGSHAVPALATLFLMSYTKILLTVANALSMYQLTCNESVLSVWSVDGNIAYGRGKHLYLVVFSCGVLVIGLAYPVLVLCAPLLEKYSDKCFPHRWNPVTKFKPLLDAYGGPYKDKYRFWTGMTLMLRLVATISFSFTSGRLDSINTGIIITIVVGIFTFWSFSGNVYRKVYLSAIESFYLLNIFVLSSVSFVAITLNTDYQVATIFFVSLSCVAFFVTATIHVLSNFNLKTIKRKLGYNNQSLNELQSVPPQEVEDRNEVNNNNEVMERSPDYPVSQVYGSERGQNRFDLILPQPRHVYQHGEPESPMSPILREREPLIYTNS